MDHLNIFHPYVDLAINHENNLTRAFLIVLRSVPSAHAAWLDLVDDGHRKCGGGGVPSLHRLPQPEVATQVGELPERVSRIISVLQTDEHYFADADVGASDRVQVLDGVVSYAPELAIVIENKPLSRDVWEEQLSLNLGKFVGDADVQIDRRPACVQWHELVAAWSRLLTSGHFGPAEASLVEDFLTYVETHFDHLQPYSSVGSCGMSKARLLRRCRNILTELAPEQVVNHRGWGPCLEFKGARAPAVMIGFFPYGNPVAGLVIDVALADTQGQAQELFGRFPFGTIDSLQKAGWIARSNFHCAFMQQNLFYPEPVRDLAAYWSHWTSRADELRQRRREEFDAFFDELVAHRIARPQERPRFDALFKSTNRSKLNVCPGVSLRFEIPLDRASDLDNRRELVSLVAREMRRVADLFDMPLSEVVGR